jgi:hypothetical protein
MRLSGNKYNRMEFAGAFGDLGTFIPFVVGYITINKMDPLGILLSFGLFKIFAGLYFKTPMPIQPMKAIGGAAIANPELVTHGMIWGSGIFTGLLWLIMGLSGAIDILARITKKPVVIGIMLGLGFSFIYDGIKMIAAEPIIGIIGVVITFLFLTNTRFPAMLLLLLFGIAVSFIRNPELFSELMKTGMHLRLPEFGILNIDREGMIKGILMLGIPQIPLTLGNAIIAITAENNRLFPKRKVKERTIAIDHGFMNIFSTTIGGVPLCHGAGGMAGHVRFGAKTGGALVILGVMLVIIGLFFSDSVAVLFNIFPAGILGVILCFAGLELASVAKGIGWEKEDAYVMLATAGISLWNIGVGFLAGLILYYAIKYRIVKV